MTATRGLVPTRPSSEPFLEMRPGPLRSLVCPHLSEGSTQAGVAAVHGSQSSVKDLAVVVSIFSHTRPFQWGRAY